MTIEIILLALASTIRPTSLAAVYAILCTDRSRRLMIVYCVSGIMFTTAFGLLVVWAFNGVTPGSGSDRTEAVAEIAGGVLLLAFAAATLAGLVGGPQSEDAPQPGGRWARVLEQRLTVKTVALAGPVTHIPGLFYLVALNVIVTHRAGVIVGLVEVLIYNAIWFAVPIAALALCVVAPEAARATVGTINDWAGRNTRTIVISVSTAMGTVLLVRGLLSI
jgi:hypothetical protein